MLRFITSRLLQAVAVVFCIVTITFFMVRLAPGDPFSDERELTPEARENIDAYYGLDRPLFVQYLSYIGKLLTGDLGPSFKHLNHTVAEIIGDSFPISLQLGLYAFLISLVIGIPTGILAAVKQNSLLDYVPMSGAMIGICLPTFVMGPLLALIFGIKLGWLNVSGWFIPQTDWILPSLTLGLYYGAYIARLTRSGMLEILSQDFIRTARAKGVPPLRIIVRHTLRGALLPVVAYLGPTLAGLISGSFVVETIFRIPGLGRFFIEAAINRDHGLILGTVIFYATLIVLLNLVVDIIQSFMNPRKTARS